MLRSQVGIVALVVAFTLLGSRAAAEPAPKVPAADPANLPPILNPPKPGERAFLGVVLNPQFSEDDAKDLGLPGLTGTQVMSVAPQAPADVVGLQPGDVILQFRNVKVKDQAHLIQLVTGLRPGATAPLVVWRDGGKVQAKPVLRDFQEYVKSQQPSP